MSATADHALTLEPGPGVLQVYLLGTVEFEAALALQKKLHYDISGDRKQAALILCEHPPLITIGRQGSPAQIQYEPAELAARRWPVRWVNRGGGGVLHLPGQLAMYPILPLDRFGLSLAEYVRLLGSVIEEMAADFHLRTRITASPAGVFADDRLVAAIGVAVRDWVSYFGAYINVQPPLDLYRKMRAGHGRGRGLGREALEAISTTSLERERRGSGARHHGARTAHRAAGAIGWAAPASLSFPITPF